MSPPRQPAQLAVPVIDISSIIACKTDEEVIAKANDHSIEAADFHKLVQDLSAAATEWGFFYIANHGMTEEYIEQLRAASLQFFALPADVKNKVRRSERNTRGYFDGELTKNKLDWKQIFDLSSRYEDVPPSETTHQRMRDDQNLWLPEEDIPGFRKTVQDYYDRVQLIARRLTMLFSVALGKDALYLDQFYKNAKGELTSSSIVRLNYYPIAPEPEKTMGVYEHTDPGAVTVLLQDDDVASLQVLHRETQQWVGVPPIKNTFVINIGDMLQIWSNDRFQAPVHRVLSNSTSTRLSIPLFYLPTYEANIEPLIPEDSQEKPHYRTLNWYEFFHKRVVGNFADLGEEVQITHYRI